MHSSQYNACSHVMRYVLLLLVCSTGSLCHAILWRNQYCVVDEVVNKTEVYYSLHGIAPINENFLNFTFASTDVKSNKTIIGNLYFSICRRTRNNQVSSKKLAPCRSDTGICLGIIDPANATNVKYNSLGDVNRWSRMELVNNKPTLNLTSRSLDLKSICPNITRVESIIQFECGKGKTKIELRKNRIENEKCVFQFSGTTPFACNETEHNQLEEQEDFKFLDSRLNATINMKPFFNHQGQVNASYSSNNDSYIFFFNPDKVTRDKYGLSQCQNSFICQHKLNSNFSRELATKQHHTVSEIGNGLHMKIISNSTRCGKDFQKNVTSIIRLICSKSKDAKLTFDYESHHCDYVFEWESDQLCVDKLVSLEDVGVPVATISSISDAASKPSENEKFKPSQPGTLPKTEPKQELASAVPVESAGSVKKDSSTATTTSNPSPATDYKIETSPVSNSHTDLTPTPGLATSQPDHKSNTRGFGLVLLIMISVTSILLAVVLLIKDAKR